MEQITFRFEIPQAEVLNANSLPNHYIVKGKKASALRERGAAKGLENHPQASIATERYHAIRAEEELKVRKSRAKKKMNKSGATDKEIDDRLAEIAAEFAPEKSSDSIAIEYPFTKYSVDVIVEAPTRRRFDPPNLYPTVKHIVDGMTDASFWEDDSFDKLVSMSFRAGGLSGIPKTFAIILNISELEADDQCNS